MEIFILFLALILLVVVSSIIALRHKFIDGVLNSKKQFPCSSSRGLHKRGFSKDLSTGETRSHQRPIIF